MITFLLLGVHGKLPEIDMNFAFMAILESATQFYLENLRTSMENVRVCPFRPP